MVQVFRDTCRQTSQVAGLGGLLAFWLPTLADLVKNASAERLLAARHLSRTRIMRLCGLLTLIGGVLSISLTLLQWWMSTVLNSSAFITARCQQGCSLADQDVSGPGALAVSLFQPLVALCLPFGLLGILLLQQHRWARRLVGLALLGQVAAAGSSQFGGDSYATALGQWLFPSGVVPRSLFHLLHPLLLLAWFVQPVAIICCGLLTLKTRQLSAWSVVLLLLGGVLALQSFWLLPASIVFHLNLDFSLVLSVDSALAIVASVLWAGLGYALWTQKAEPLAHPEPQAL